MTKLEKIKDLCERKGIRITNLEKELGFSKGSLSKMDVSKPSAERLSKLAKYFDIPVYYFDDDIQDMNDLLDKQRSQIYEAVFGGNQELIAEYKREKGLSVQPVFEVSAGNGRVNGAFATEYMDDEQTDADSSWCTVCGDSMYPELHDGDKVRVHHQTETTPQDLTVVKIDGESCTVKYVEITDTGVWLRAINKDVFEDRFFTIREVMQLPVKIIGKVVEVRREY